MLDCTIRRRANARAGEQAKIAAILVKFQLVDLSPGPASVTLDRVSRDALLPRKEARSTGTAGTAPGPDHHLAGSFEFVEEDKPYREWLIPADLLNRYPRVRTRC